jgi:hypothetical protein
MITLPFGARLGVFGFAAILLAPSLAEAHSICGSRVFPATLAIDDPGVSDELALPTLTAIPTNADGAREFDASFSWTKTLVENLGLAVSDGKTWLKPGGNGWGNVDTELKYQFFCDDSHEFMGSVGFDVSWANTGTPGFADSFNTYSPVIDIGKGFGDLPTSLNALRPFAVTGEAVLSVPGQSIADGGLNPTVLSWGFTVQYSLPYMNANISAIGGPDFLKRLIFIAEADFQTPVSHAPPGGYITTGTVQPGVVYLADSWQLAVEAMIPINNASGHSVGAIAQVDFFLDDLFPNSFLGKPLFGGH